MTYPFNEHVNHLTPYQPGKSIEAVAREYGLKRIVKLASNENPLGPSPKVIEALKTVDFELARYPDGDGYTCKHALAEYLNVSADMLSLANGSDTLFEAMLKIAIAPGESVLISEFAFAAYPIACKGFNIPFTVVPSKDYGHDLDAMQAAVTETTRIVFIANPNNPTGTLLTHDEIENFLEGLPASTYLVLDEAYFEYAEAFDYPRSLELLGKYPNLVITRTFSKAYGLAGLRFGYSISTPEVADRFNRIRLPFNTTSITQKIVPIALADQAHVKRTVEVNAAGLQQWYQALEQHQLKYIKSYGNFVTAEFNHSGQDMFQHFLERGVITRPLTPYQMNNHLRISIGDSDENQFAIDALNQIMEKLA